MVAVVRRQRRVVGKKLNERREILFEVPMLPSLLAFEVAFEGGRAFNCPHSDQP
jgi:hypothetical protein